MLVEEDGQDVGFTTYDYGCNVCPNKGWDGDKPVRYAIVRHGNLMCCERCGGCYGGAPALPPESGSGAQVEQRQEGGE